MPRQGILELPTRRRTQSGGNSRAGIGMVELATSLMIDCVHFTEILWGFQECTHFLIQQRRCSL